MNKIETEKAPKAIGPYSQAVIANGLVFVSGQLPLHPTSGTIEEISIEGQTRQALANLQAILHAAGCTLDHVVRTEIYLQDLSHFSIVNQIYAEFFTHTIKPARQVLQVARIPRDALIEISCIAKI